MPQMVIKRDAEVRPLLAPDSTPRVSAVGIQGLKLDPLSVTAVPGNLSLKSINFSHTPWPATTRC